MIHPSRLLGATGKLAAIAPPGRSYGDWKRFLDECEAAGIIANVGDDGKAELAGPLSFALVRRWRWLHESCELGLSFEDAERSWNAGVERERAAIRESLEEQDRRRAAAMRERDGKNPNRRRNDLLGYARETGL